MKRHIFLLIFFLTAITAYSQRSYRFTWALSANDYTMDGYGTHLGYRFGPGIEFKKEDSWFSYGFDILFTSKGTSGHEGRVVQKYIQVPANFNFHFPVSPKVDIIWANSVFLAYAYKGQSKSVENGVGYTTSPFSDDNVWGKSIPRFDAGLTTGCHVDFGRYVLGLNFELGLVPLDSYTSYNEYDEEEINATLNGSVFLSFAIKF